MRNTVTTFALASVLITSVASSITPAYAAGSIESGFSQRIDGPAKDRSRDRRSDRVADRRDNIRDEIRQERRQEARQDRRQTRRVVRRTVRRIEARHGHFYPGYGHIYVDNDAWKWIAFAGITFAILDLISEEAQRAHEAAQIAATTAAINEAIRWQNGNAFGQVTATREYIGSNGLTYRDFPPTITVNGKTETLVVTGYLQADGSWKLVS